MKANGIRTILVAAAAILAAALPALAAEAGAQQPAVAKGGCGAPANSAAAAPRTTWEEAVGLTAEQKARVARLDAEGRARQQALSAKAQDAQKELGRLLAEPAPSLKRVKSLTRRAMGYQADLQIAAVEARVQRHNLLTAPQREALAKWQASSGGACGCGGGSASGGGGCGSGGGGCGSTQTSGGGGGCGG